MSESARAMMNQWVDFIRFCRTHRTINTIRLATIDTITENPHHNSFNSVNAKIKFCLPKTEVTLIKMEEKQYITIYPAQISNL